MVDRIRSILLTQESIHEILAEIAQLLAMLKNSVFLSQPLWIFFQKKKKIPIPKKISHKLCVRMDGTQFLILWWFTAKNERGKDKIAWVYVLFSVTQVYKETQWLEIVIKSKIKFSFHKITYFQRRFNPYMQLHLLQRQTKTPKTISNVFKCCLIKSNCLPT